MDPDIETKTNKGIEADLSSPVTDDDLARALADLNQAMDTARTELHRLAARGERQRKVTAVVAGV